MILQPTLTAILALSGTTVAAAIASRDPGDGRTPPTRTVVGPVPAFNVTGFVASAFALSLRVGYTFNVTISPELTDIYCFYLGTTYDRDLSSTPETRCSYPEEGNSNNTGVTFRWAQQNDGVLAAKLTIKRQVNPLAEDPDELVDEAVYNVPVSETLRYNPEGRFARTAYNGTENFSVEAWRFQKNLVALGLAGSEERAKDA